MKRRAPRRRRYRRNPSIGGFARGLDLKSAGFAIAGMVVAKMVAARVGPMLKITNPKAQAALTLAVGVVSGGLTFIPAGGRKAFALGGQVAGLQSLLAQVAPGTFGGIVPLSDVSQLSGGMELPFPDMIEADEFSGDFGDYGDALEPDLASTT